MLKTILLLLVTLALAQASKNRCAGMSTCKECLLASGECYWCTDKKFKFSRCNTRSVLESSEQNCQKIDTEDGRQIKGPTDKDTNFGPTVQVHPQEVSFKLRPDQSLTFKISVKPAKNYPVQIYYLMDMSKSMEDDQQRLMTLGRKIAEEIGQITKKFELGFGSFVDKTVSSFSQVELLKEPCKLQNNESCDPTYGFRHNFDFNNESLKFEQAVAAQKISGNMDVPEGGFDALMQVAVCEKTLSWKDPNEVRRIVIYVTDASPHISGDGKIGGIVVPNDAKCHMEQDPSYPTMKYYAKTNEMDYPSLSQLRAKLKANKIVPILAVTQNVYPLYEKLAEQWKDTGASIGVLKSDSSNIVDLVKESYSKIASTVRLSDDSSSNIQVKYSASCKTGVSNECKGVKVNQQVDFDVTLSAIDCPAGGKNEKFKISIPGFGEVFVNVELICDCPCERSKGVESAVQCNNNGTLKCGICDCKPGRYGPLCSCDDQAKADNTLCIPGGANATTTEVCSGAGDCICGKCECRKRADPVKERVYGKFCQCNNFGCDRHEGKLCGGPGRGVCDCQECKCNEAFQGSNCGQVNCTIGRQRCMSDDGLICSGNGDCSCDRCVCNYGYKGDKCENCVNCPTQCRNVKDCVFCQAFNKGPKEVCDKCNLNIEIVNKTEEKCSYLDGECYIIYSFKDDIFLGTVNETILVQKEKRCIVIVPVDAPILAIVLGTIGGIVLLGLILLLLWKLAITAYDNYEYHQFEKDRMKSQWENAENPLYKPSKQQYQNPTYAGNK